ncbi:unnamed protein product [Notodromas monacha]|uniref:Zinc transporter ZIP14 n=1 Tax=Notodromas monacha TaxID=399045 RepID=A0A7R9BFJ1_9CRUS|nr:unnamed protein product [Notodromas monacha]CAG0913858.1 unnamed protein product [Notodromas monacha]
MCSKVKWLQLIPLTMMMMMIGTLGSSSRASIIPSPGNNSSQSVPQTHQPWRFGPHEKPSKTEIWGYGMLLVTGISSCSVIGGLCLPCISNRFYPSFMTVLIGLAMGTLLSSACFHLLPTALQAHEIFEEKGDYLFPALGTVIGAYSFLLVETCLKVVLQFRQRPKGNPATITCVQTIDTEDVVRCQEPAIKASFGHPEYRKKTRKIKDLFCGSGTKSKAEIASVAWMIIVGDSLHNFVDGVAIGAAFSESVLVGLSVSIAVICEEFPHELGDLAVLINAGMSIRRALLYNFASALSCYVGLAFGILLGDVTESASIIFGVAGGIFLYISLTDMAPELNEAAANASKEGLRAWGKVVILQTIGFSTGVAFLFLMAYFQDSMQLETGL